MQLKKRQAEVNAQHLLLEVALEQKQASSKSFGGKKKRKIRWHTAQRSTTALHCRKLWTLFVTQQRHSITLHYLHRRVVLDDARELISTRYNFTTDELRFQGQGVAGKLNALPQLVGKVRARLRPDDALLLNDDALCMIFDGSFGTVRSEGNTVAHSASKEDLSLAFHGLGLTASQAATLQNIYTFANHKIPQL